MERVFIGATRAEATRMADEWWGSQKGLRQTLRAINLRYEDEADDEPGAIASEGYTLPSAVAQRIRLSEMKPRERPPASPPNDEWIL